MTLRRVAFGESAASVLRADDLARLYELALIEGGKDGRRLTAEGRQRFDALPKVAKYQPAIRWRRCRSSWTRCIAKAATRATTRREK